MIFCIRTYIIYSRIYMIFVRCCCNMNCLRRVRTFKNIILFLVTSHPYRIQFAAKTHFCRAELTFWCVYGFKYWETEKILSQIGFLECDILFECQIPTVIPQILESFVERARQTPSKIPSRILIVPVPTNTLASSENMCVNMVLVRHISVGIYILTFHIHYIYLYDIHIIKI